MWLLCDPGIFCVMEPSTYFTLNAVGYLVVTVASFVALSRIVVPGLVQGAVAERAAWLVAYAVVTGLGIAAYVYAKKACDAECARYHTTAATQRERNARTFAGILVWTGAASVLLALLALTNAIFLRDALTATTTIGGPLVTMWFWASAVSYAPFPRLLPPE